MKNPLYRLVLSSLRKHPTQNLAAILMMSLSFCFVTAGTQVYASQEMLNTMQISQSYSSAQAMLLDAWPDTWESMKSSLPLYASGEVISVAAHDLGADYNHMKITLGAMDETALAMSGFTLTAGAWPRESGEIALSETSLMRLGTNTQVGENLALSPAPLGSSATESAASKTYRLCGIFQENTEEWSNNLGDGYFYSSDLTAYTFDNLPVRETIPTALLAFKDAKAMGDALPGLKTSYFLQFAGKGGGMADDWELYHLNEQTIAPFLRSLNAMPYFVRNSKAYQWYDQKAILYERLLRLATSMILGGLVVLLLGSGIAGSFETRLSERRQQIGLIRAIGASRSQAIRLALLEALALMLPSLLLGIAMGSLTARLCLNRLSEITGNPSYFVFPSAEAILGGFGFCAALLCFFALRPMLRLTRKSPVALLNLQTSGAMAKKLRTKNRLPKHPLRFLARRYVKLHRSRHVFPVLVLSACLSLMMLTMTIYGKNMLQYKGYEAKTDDIVTMDWGRYGGSWSSPFLDFDLDSLNPQHWKETSDSPDVVAEKVQSIPGIRSVSIAKQASLPLLFLQPRQVMDYVKQLDWFYQEPFEREDRLKSRTDAAAHVGMPGDLPIWNPESIGWQESGIQGIDEASLAALQASLMAGSIDLPAIRSGEAVLLGASNYYKRPGTEEGSWDIGLTNEAEGKYIYCNDVFKVGDTVTFGKVYIVEENGTEHWKAVTQTARICGLVSQNPGAIFTTADRFSAWGFPDGITHMLVTLPLNGLYNEAYHSLDMLAQQYNFRVDSRYQSNLRSRRSFEGTVFLYQAILILFSMMGLALLISSTLSRLCVREREISLLRAVGLDSQKTKRLLYTEAVRDGLWSAALGTMLGVLVCGLYNGLAVSGTEIAAVKSGLAYYVSLLKGVPLSTAAAAFLLFPLTGLAVSFGFIRRLLRRSIVSGISQVE